MTTTRHFTFRVDTGSPDGEGIVEHVAGIEDPIINAYRPGRNAQQAVRLLRHERKQMEAVIGSTAPLRKPISARPKWRAGREMGHHPLSWA